MFKVYAHELVTIEKKEVSKETPQKVMDNYQTPHNSEPIPAIKSGKIETNLNFSPTK